MNQEISLQDLAPSTLVDGAPSDISKQDDQPDFTRQGSSSFNSLPMQENQSPKGGDHQTPEFDGNVDLSFLGYEQGNAIGGTSDSSVAAANVPGLQRLDFDPSSFSTPLMGVSASAFPAMSNTVQSASSTFDPLHEDSTNEEQTRSSLVNPASPFPAQMEMIPTNEMVPPFSVGNDVNWTPNQFNSQSQDVPFPSDELVPFPSELFLPPPVLPFNQSSILCNDQVGQYMVDVNVINNGIRRTTQFPTSFPQNMTATGILEGTPSWINQNEPEWLLPSHNTLQGPITPSRYQPNQFMGANLFDSQCTNPMLPGSSMPLWPQELPPQSRFSDQVPGMLSGAQPPMNQWPQQLPYLFNQLPITPNVYDAQGSTMFPESLTLRSPQFPSHIPQVSGEDDVLINSQCYNSMLFGPTESSWHPNSFTHQSHPGHVYMTPNATATQLGGFNQSAPSCLAPWIQYFSNQVQVNRGAVMPGIDNMQKENFVPWNLGNSTSRSQMDNLQVQGMLSQTARPNASNLGRDTSLQSQIMGLNSQQKNKGKRAEASSLHPEMMPTQNYRNESMILGGGSRGNSHFNIGESSSSKLPRTEWSRCHDDQESSNVSSSGSRVVKNDIYDPLFEGIGLNVDPHLRILGLI